MRHAERLIEQLGLTGEQETKVRSMVREHVKRAIRAHADLEVNRLDLRDLVDAEPVDLAKVKTLLQSMAAQRVDLHVAHITLMQEIRGLLTPEQQEKFRSMRRQMMRGEGGMMGRGGMRGQGGMRNPCGMMGGSPRTQ
jgi:Spy/CpxP family protein refolding chaperone